MWRAALAVAALFAVLPLLLPRADSGAPPGPVQPPLMEGLAMRQYHADGSLQWSLQGASLRLRDGAWHWREVRARMAAGGWQLRGERAIYDEGAEVLHLYGAVRGSGGGMRLGADELRWDFASQQLRSDGPVRLDGEFGSLSGVGLVADMGRGNWRILGRVRGVHGGH